MGHFGVKFAAPTVDIDALRGWKDGVVKKLTGGLSGLAKARKVTVVSGHRPVHLAQPARGRGRQGRQEDGELRAGDHRRRLRARDPAVHPARRPARDRLHRRPRARRRAQAPAGRRRRDHRPGDGDGLPRAGRQGDHRRADGPDHPGCGQGHGDPAAQADRQAVREHLPQGQGDQGRGQAGRAGGQLRGRQRARQRHLRPHPGGGRPEAQRQGDRGRERRRDRRRARLHPGRQAAAHQRAAHLRHRRRGRPADARPQGGARGQGRGRGRRRA